MHDAEFWTDPFNGKGLLVDSSPDKRVWICQDEHDPKKTHVCTTYRVDPILDANAEDYADNLNAKWGDGDIAARIPLPLYFSETFLPAVQEGDTAYLKRLLNDPDYSKLRRRPGKL